MTLNLFAFLFWCQEPMMWGINKTMLITVFLVSDIFLSSSWHSVEIKGIKGRSHTSIQKRVFFFPIKNKFSKCKRISRSQLLKPSCA